MYAALLENQGGHFFHFFHFRKVLKTSNLMASAHVNLDPGSGGAGVADAATPRRRRGGFFVPPPCAT